MAAEQGVFDVKAWLTKNAPTRHELGLAGLAELVHNVWGLSQKACGR